MTDRVDHGGDEDGGRAPASSVHKVDLAVAAVILAVCGFLYWDTTTFARIPQGLAQNVPPALFPRLLIVVIAAMAVFLPFEHVQKRRMGIDLEAGRRDRIRPVTYLTGLALFVMVLITPWLGTLPAMVIACAALPLLWGERRYWLVAIYALALPLAVTLLFVAGLEVNFMPGIVGHPFR